MSRNDARDVIPDRAITHLGELTDNIPYLAMMLMGSAILWIGVEEGTWRWLSAGLYLAYGVAGAFWVMVFICPYCHFYDTRLCPCGYGQIAPKLRSRKDGGDFARQFRKHIPVIVPLWFIPLIAGGILLFHNFSWVLVGLLPAFVVDAFVILPLVSREHGCSRCTQKNKCPWMAPRRTEP